MARDSGYKGVNNETVYFCDQCGPLYGPPEECFVIYTPDPLDGVLKECSGHGQYQTSGCQCFINATAGFWALAPVDGPGGVVVQSCVECLPPYTPPLCLNGTSSPTLSPTGSPSISPTVFVPQSLLFFTNLSSTLPGNVSSANALCASNPLSDHICTASPPRAYISYTTGVDLSTFATAYNLSGPVYNHVGVLLAPSWGEVLKGNWSSYDTPVLFSNPFVAANGWSSFTTALTGTNSSGHTRNNCNDWSNSSGVFDAGYTFGRGGMPDISTLACSSALPLNMLCACSGRPMVTLPLVLEQIDYGSQAPNASCMAYANLLQVCLSFALPAVVTNPVQTGLQSRAPRVPNPRNDRLVLEQHGIGQHHAAIFQRDVVHLPDRGRGHDSRPVGRCGPRGVPRPGLHLARRGDDSTRQRHIVDQRVCHIGLFDWE